MDPILICAAVEEELAFLRPRLAAMDHAAHLRIAGQSALAVAVGIGPVEAALGATAAFQRFRPRLAVLVGTCGALPGSRLAIGSAVLVERAILTSSDAAAGLSYVPGDAATVASDPAFCKLARGAGLSGVGCATVVAVTTDAGHAAALARDGSAVEHLEAYGFLRAAVRCAVPAVCILGVANDVGPGAHDAWRQNAPAAAAAAIAALERVLASV